MSVSYGFRVVGDLYGRRALVDWPRAFAAHGRASLTAEPGRECYMSLYTFGDDFAAHLTAHRSPKGFRGPCAAPWLWFDIDREGDLPAALADARGLMSALLEHYSAFDADDLLVFFSGAKGFHIGLPGPAALSPLTPAACRLFAEGWAAAARVRIDAGIYDPARCFRAPNSRHPKTGRHKRRLDLDELTHLTADRIANLSSEPRPFDVPAPAMDATLAADWQAVVTAAERATEAKGAAAGPTRLTKTTLRTIQLVHVPEPGDRHRALFSAAANLGENGCPPALALALLAEAGDNCGLPPADTRRQIETGVAHGRAAADGR